jgi:hypothetical protein
VSEQEPSLTHLSGGFQIWSRAARFVFSGRPALWSPKKFGLTGDALRPGKRACGGLGRLRWLVIGAFHASLLVGADLYLAGPSVESVRHGGADGRHLIPENNRHSRCDDDGSRDDGHGHGVVHPANMRLRGTQASRIPCHDQTDPTTGGPRCGVLPGLIRRACHRPGACVIEARSDYGPNRL